MNTLNVFCLGIISYKSALNIQEKLQKKVIDNEISDCLLLLEHPPTITTGRRGNTDNLLINKELLEKNNIHFEITGRGGDITFHGPGQVVGYPIINLRNYKNNVHNYIRNLEETILLALKDFNIEGRRVKNLTGVWVKRSKIASIGVGIKRWVTYHGFALNVNTNISYFDFIVPCGIPNVSMTSIKDWLNRSDDVDVKVVYDSLINNFLNVFNINEFKICNYENLEKYCLLEEFSKKYGITVEI